ncbi:hypothetical protein D3C81_1721800 [compost metagenome]
MFRRTPSSLSDSMVPSAPSMSLSITFSVISSSRRWAGKAVSSRISRTSATTSLRRNCAGDRFTETSTSAGQSWAVRQASRSTQRPSATMMSLCSANGMKVSGPSNPSCGCCQRSKASTATMRRSLRR